MNRSAREKEVKQPDWAELRENASGSVKYKPSGCNNKYSLLAVVYQKGVYIDISNKTHCLLR